MKRIKYSRWDGTRSWPDLPEEELTAEIFRELNNYMNWSLSAQEAMEWLLRQGINLAGLDMRIAGTDELLQDLRRRRQDAFSRHNFDHALDEIRERIARIVELELTTCRAEFGSIHPELHRREGMLRSLPSRPVEALAKLTLYDQSPGFMDSGAKRLFDELTARREAIDELEQFIMRHGRQFQGPESLDFDQALEVMARFKRLAELAEALRTGNFRQASIEGLEEALGEEAVHSFLILSNFTERLEKSGLIRQTGEGIRLTPRGLRKIGQNALGEIFKNLQKDCLGLHPMHQKGAMRRNHEETVPYEYGKALDLEVMGTLKNALRRGAGKGRLGLEVSDFEIYEERQDTQVTTVLMLDMSWSMSRDGRFPAAKRVALAMDHLIRSAYSRDNYYTIGFSTRARELNAEQLTEATWDPSDPFTNIQEGLALARRLFRRHRSTNRHVIIITDGQPTATHIDGHTSAQWPGFMGSIPPDIHRETLKEVDNCTREQVTINIFMLDDNPVLVKFVEEMARINRGRAFYSHPDNLGKYLMVDYLAQRRKKIS